MQKILFVIRKAPHQLLQTREAFDILLAASEFNIEINLLFCEDGIFQLLQQQNTLALGIANFTHAYQALTLYDIKNIYLAGQDLIKRDVSENQLLLKVKMLTNM